MATKTDLSCPWCGDRPCVGDGFVNSAGAGDPCGATDHQREGATADADLLAHQCNDCGEYACGIHTLTGGLCPNCGDKDEAADVIASEQIQSAFLS
jgi:hypothetical protein